MILITGGTGTLGERLVPRLRDRGLNLRLLTRRPGRVRHLESGGVELFGGDLRDPDAVGRAMQGVTTVIAAAQGGFGATDGATPRSVDGDGHGRLIALARAQRVEHFILTSIFDAAPDHPLELWRQKYRAEEELKTSGLDWTVVAPAPFMEWALNQFGDPLLATGRTAVFGRGNMPINFISADDVAAVIEQVVLRPAGCERISLAGPENFTLNEVVHAVQLVRAEAGRVRHVPLPAMRLMAGLLTPLQPALAREIKAGIYLDTVDRRIAPAASHDRFPGLAPTRLSDVIQHRVREPTSAEQ